jgi:hypothetical protein
MRSDWQLRKMAQAAVSTLLVLAVASGCKRRSIAVGGEEAPPAAETVPNKTPAPSAPAPTASESHFLDPLIGAPWLGHADDGALVRVEFFISSDRGSALCRTNIDHAFGGAPTAKSPFTATADLAHIMWDDGNSRASFDPATQTVTARVASNARVHQVALRQTSVTTNPELATFRSSVPLDEHTKAEHQKFTATLESGNRWWKSIDGWDKLVTPQDIVADDTSVALIRPGWSRMDISTFQSNAACRPDPRSPMPIAPSASFRNSITLGMSRQLGFSICSTRVPSPKRCRLTG